MGRSKQIHGVILSLLVLAGSVLAAPQQTVSVPTTYATPSSLTISTGVPLLGSWVFAAGSTVDVSLATKLGFPAGGGGSFPASPLQGDLIYYDGAAWARLAAGDFGQRLQTQGVSANPIWGNTMWKEPVRAAQQPTDLLPHTRSGNTITATANGAFPTLDTTMMNLGDRFLLWQGSPAADHGIYVITSLGSGSTPWTAVRATDADTTAKFHVGARFSCLTGYNYRGALFDFRSLGDLGVDTGVLNTDDALFDQDQYFPFDHPNRFLTGYEDGAFESATILESNLDFSFTDITTLNVSTTKHGLAPKLPNDATKFFNGIGGYTVPPDVGWNGGAIGLVAATGRTSLGLGSLATQSGTFSGTSSGTNTGDQDLSGLMVKTNNLSDVANKLTSNQNLGTAYNQDVAKSADFTVATTDRGKVFEVTTGSSNVTATLPSAATAGNGFFVMLRKADTGTGRVLNSAVTNALGIQGHTYLLWTDGTTYYARFFGGATDASGNYTYTSGGDITLSPNTGNVVSLNTHKLTNVVDPTAAQDGATKNYVDTTLSTFDEKPYVAYASTTALPANTYANGSSGVGATLTGNSNGPLIIDGVTIVIGALGKRVLVAGEAAPANNGWYTITQIGVVAVSPYILTRATESDQAAEIGAGYMTSVIAPNNLTPGSSNNGKVFISVAADPFTVGTTSLTFSQIGSTYAAGNGLSLSGSIFSIDTGVTVDKTTAQTLTNKSIDGSEINSGTVPIAQIPTGSTSSTVPLGNDTRFPASVTGIRHGAGAGSTDTAETIGAGLTESSGTLKTTDGWAYVYLGSDFTSSGTGSQDITGMVTPTLGATTSYDFEARIYCTNAGDTAGTKFAVVSASSTGGIWSFFGTASATTILTSSNVNNSLSGIYNTTASGFAVVEIHGSCTTPSGSPTIKVQLAKQTSGTCTVKAAASWVGYKVSGAP